MSSQKRLAMFVVLSAVIMIGTDVLMDRLGLKPKPVPAPAAAPDAAAPPAVAAQPAQAEPGKAAADKPAQAPAVAAANKELPPLAKPAELVLGASDDRDPAAYHLEVRLDQIGAGVRQLLTAKYDGETPDGIPDPRMRLHLIKENPLSKAPTPFSLTLRADGRPLADGPKPAGEVWLDLERWEVVREKPDAPAVRTVTKSLPDGTGQAECQEIAFRVKLDDPRLTVTKLYRLWKGKDGFDLELTFEGEKDAKLAYRLFGPHGIPIEGESYTATFRDVFFGQVKDGRTDIVTRTAGDVVGKAKSEPERITTLPLKFTGVENQYFAVFLEPDPIPTNQDTRLDRESLAFVAWEDPKASQKSDVGVEIASKEVSFGPNRPVTHAYRVFAGPKIASALLPYEATELASYRKNQWFSIPFAGTLAQNVIAPLLEKIYGLTASVARLFGGKAGNYGIAIILLTITFKLILFPLGRKQALISKKMQELAPHLAALKEKYKDDKERQTKETFALYKEHGFNPAAGCLPALIQLPIFVGLWQALNNSVALRHSQFLYIKNLAAPDMLFPFPMELPVVGKYFNLLPILSVCLFLVQAKLFTPPAVTEEAKMQQKMMKYMVVFMGVMFYKFPAGLSIYYITSNLWQICERLLVPKLTRSKPVAVDPDFGGRKGDMNGGGSTATLIPPAKPSTGGWLTKKLEKLLEDAQNERTIRNNGGRDPGNGRDSLPDRNRNRPRNPGKRR